MKRIIIGFFSLVAILLSFTFCSDDSNKAVVYNDYVVGTTIRDEDIVFRGSAENMPKWLYHMDVSYWSLQDSEKGPVMFIKLVSNRKIKKLRKMGYIK